MKNKNIQAENELKRQLQIVEAGIDSQFELIEAAGETEKKLKKFRMVAYTGGKIRQRFSQYPIVVDLSGLKVTAKSRPILRDHKTSQIVGHTENITVSSSRIDVEGVISATNQHGLEVTESAQNGFPWQASIGAEINQFVFVDKGEKVSVNGRNFTGPLYLVRQSTLLEVSFVALGADDNTTAKVAATLNEGNQEMEFSQWLKSSGFEEDQLTDGQLKALKATYEASQNGEGDEITSLQATQPAVENQNGSTDEIIAQMRTQVSEEQSRINAINALDYNNSEIKSKAISEGWNIQRTELELLRDDRSSGPAIHSTRSKPKSNATIEATLLLTAGVDESQVGKWFDESTMEAALSNEMIGYSIQALCHDVIRASGGQTNPGHIGPTFINATKEAERTLRAAGGFSTVSLSGILGNVANKLALASFMAVPRTSHLFCETTSMNDFKTHTSYRLTAAGQLEKVGPDGELKHGELGEESYTNKLETYGRMFGLNRQQIINDDLGEFAKIPKLIGRQSALSLEQAVFVLLLDNSDNFFSANNKNYFEGAATNLQISSLSTGEQMFLDQVDKEGKPIVLAPSILLVPTSEKVNAEQIHNDTTVNETTTTNKPKTNSNPHAGKFKPVASTFLNSQALAGSSSTAWYLFANPNDVAAMEIGFLKGRKVPVIESEDAPFNVLGVEFRGYFDFGVAKKDHRAAVMSKGKA